MDKKKSAENLSKHGLAFEDAKIVFSDRCVTFEDARYDYVEQRFITFGQLEGRVVVPPEKKQLTIQLDEDVLEWLKGQGKGYQSRINSERARLPVTVVGDSELL